MIKMNSKQRGVLVKIIDDIEFLMGDYIRIQDDMDANCHRSAIGINAIHIVQAFTNNKEALEAAKLLLNTLELINAMQEREAWNYDSEHTTKAVKPCEKVVKQVEALAAKLEHTPTRYRDIGLGSCAEEYLEP